jgi:hypothetical protein
VYFLVKQQLELFECHITQNTAGQTPPPTCVNVSLALELDTIGNKIFAQQPFKNVRVTMCGRYFLSCGPSGATKILSRLSGGPSIDDYEVPRHVNQFFGYPVVDIV